MGATEQTNYRPSSVKLGQPGTSLHEPTRVSDQAWRLTWDHTQALLAGMGRQEAPGQGSSLLGLFGAALRRSLRLGRSGTAIRTGAASGS